MKQANIAQVKAQFSAFVRRAERGETVRILRDGKPVARLVSDAPQGKRVFASDDGLGFVSEDFNDPLPPELLAQFYK